MRTLTKKSEITAKTLKAEDCIYKDERIGYDKSEKLYFIGSLSHSWKRVWTESVKELKLYVR